MCFSQSDWFTRLKCRTVVNLLSSGSAFEVSSWPSKKLNYWCAQPNKNWTPKPAQSNPRAITRPAGQSWTIAVARIPTRIWCTVVWIGSSSKIRFGVRLPLHTPPAKQANRNRVAKASRAHRSRPPWNSNEVHLSLKQVPRRAAWSSNSASDNGPCSKSSPWQQSWVLVASRRLKYSSSSSSRARGTFLKCRTRLPLFLGGDERQ